MATIKCNICGGDILLSGDETYGSCLLCGSTVSIHKVEYQAPAENHQGAVPSSLLKRVFLFLEDEDWDSADEYCEKVLDIDPETPLAYLGKLMASLKVKTRESLKDCPKPFDDNKHYKKILRFADDALKAELAGYIAHINSRNENAHLVDTYNRGKQAMATAKSEKAFTEAAHLFESVSGYRDSAALAEECHEKARISRKNRILTTGKQKMNGQTVAGYEEAIKLFESIPGWQDADEQLIVCREQIKKINAELLAQKEREENARKEARRIARRNRIIALSGIGVIAAVAAALFLVFTVIIPTNNYNNAVALLESGNLQGAAAAFAELGDYKDARRQYKAVLKEIAYADAVALMEAGDVAGAMAAFEALDGYQDTDELLEALHAELAAQTHISAGGFYTVALKKDGSVMAVGSNNEGQRDISGWTDIIAVSAGPHHTVGLKADGTVVAAGRNLEGQCSVTSWTDIVAIYAGSYHTVGLKADGTVVAVGNNKYGQCKVSEWTDIVAISAGTNHTVGLKADGTVVAVGMNDEGQCDVSKWTNITAISTGTHHTVGLKSDGTVVAVGRDNDHQCRVYGWSDIMSISAGSSHTVGLRADGTVVAVGNNDYGQCDVSDWTNIVSISAGASHTVAVRADCSVLAVGRNLEGQCNVSAWKLY